jgi:hypothetical protein
VYNGDIYEKDIAQTFFSKLINHSLKLSQSRFYFNSIQYFLTIVWFDAMFKYLPHTIVWGVLAWPIYRGKYDHLSLGELIREVKYVATMIGSEFEAVGALLSLQR